MPASIDVFSLKSTLATGFEHHNDDGTWPAPCWNWSDWFYRGGVGFDMSQVNQFGNAHGFKSATLKFLVHSGDVSCLSQIQVASDDWTTWSSIPPVLPAGPQTAPILSENSSAVTVDLTAILALEVGLGGSAQHMHFVFVGNDEGNSHDNNACVVEFGNFALQLVADH